MNQGVHIFSPSLLYQPVVTCICIFRLTLLTDWWKQDKYTQENNNSKGMGLVMLPSPRWVVWWLWPYDSRTTSWTLSMTLGGGSDPTSQPTDARKFVSHHPLESCSHVFLQIIGQHHSQARAEPHKRWYWSFHLQAGENEKQRRKISLVRVIDKEQHFGSWLRSSCPPDDNVECHLISWNRIMIHKETLGSFLTSSSSISSSTHLCETHPFIFSWLIFVAN